MFENGFGRFKEKLNYTIGKFFGVFYSPAREAELVKSEFKIGTMQQLNNSSGLLSVVVLLWDLV